MIKILQSKRILLRPIIEYDSKMIFELRSDQSVNKFIDRFTMKNIDESIKFIRKIMKGNESGDYCYWIISKLDVNSAIGTICLWNFTEGKTSAEIGFELLPAFQGFGYVSESIDSVLDFAFNELNLKQITAWAHHENSSSIKVLQKKGFHFDGEKTVDGTTVESITYSTYSITRDQLKQFPK
ncbi:MAG: GNAT family N-acetyltransferase [Melioribacteraceae bacterium]|nr:GNAT family N-acetyltransferase [Melioribacteraceae bacterium]